MCFGVEGNAQGLAQATYQGAYSVCYLFYSFMAVLCDEAPRASRPLMVRCIYQPVYVGPYLADGAARFSVSSQDVDRIGDAMVSSHIF